MSRIIHPQSDVEVQSVRFADLEQGDGNGGIFFERLCPAEEAGLAVPHAERSGEAALDIEERAAAQPVDIEAVKEESYTKGKKDGRAETEKKLHSATQSLAEALEEISRLHESMLSKSKEDMVRLVMAVSRRVIRSEVEEKEDIVVGMVKKALDAAVASDEYYIRVNPEDLAIVKEHEPLFLAAMKGLQNIHFTADENISRGGCVAESRAGDVDATIETQLSEVREHLYEAVM